MVKEVSVVLGSYNRYELLQKTIASIRQEVIGLNHEIIVIDGGSTDGALEWLLAQKDIITIVQHNRGEWLGKPIVRRSWGYFMNLGFKIAQGSYVCMISDDAVFIPGSLKRGIKLCDDKRAAGYKIGGAAFYYRDWPRETLYHINYALGDKLYVNHGLYLKQALHDVDYIDEDTYQFYNADGDLCLKIWAAGYEIIPATESYVEHYQYANISIRVTNEALYKQDFSCYLKKWTGIYYDPYEHNVGRQETKAMVDEYKSFQAFELENKKVQQQHPHLFKPASLFKKIKQRTRWRVQSGLRKILKFFR